MKNSILENSKTALLLLIVFFLTCHSAAAQLIIREVKPSFLNHQQMQYLRSKERLPTFQSSKIIMLQLSDLIKTNFTIEFFGRGVEIQIDKIIEHSAGTVSYLGTIDNGTGAFNMVINNGMVTAQFYAEDFCYGIAPLGDGLHVMIEFKTNISMRDESEEGYQNMLENFVHQGFEEQIQPDSNQVLFDNMSAGNCKVRLLVAYTDDVAAGTPDPYGFIQTCINETNTALSQSQINVEIELARSIEVSYNESGNSNTDITAFESNSDNKMDEIHDLRNQYDADLCVLLVNTLNDACGVASAVSVAGYSLKFCVVKIGCAQSPDFSFAHELGHLFGCRHDLFADPLILPYAYGHGYVSSGYTWRTIMAYDDACDCTDEFIPCPPETLRITPNSPTCGRIQNFSNPSVSHNGEATGTTVTSNNASAMINSKSTIIAMENTDNIKVIGTDVIEAKEKGDVFALTQISNSGTYEIKLNAEVTWRAQNTFILNPGFIAYNGSKFYTSFDNCAASPIQPSKLNKFNSEFINSFEIAPNPVSLHTSASFGLKINCQVLMEIYNIQGQKQKILISSFLQSGNYQISINVNDLSNGIYFCKLQAGEETFTNKLVVAK